MSGPEPRGSRFERAIGVLTCLLTLVGVLACTVRPYVAGRWNTGPLAGLHFLTLAGFGLLVLVCGMASFVFAARAFARGQRGHATVLGVCLGLSLLTWFSTAPVSRAIWPDGPWAAGFERWASTAILPNVATLRTWAGRLPPTTRTAVDVYHPSDPPAPGDIPPDQWPAVVAALRPARVHRTADGLLLEWGQFGTWGDCRRVFVPDVPLNAFDDGSPHFRYRRLTADLYAAVQEQG